MYRILKVFKTQERLTLGMERDAAEFPLAKINRTRQAIQADDFEIKYALITSDDDCYKYSGYAVSQLQLDEFPPITRVGLARLNCLVRRNL